MDDDSGADRLDPQERLETQIASWDEPLEPIVAHAPVSSDAIW
jgi:hypothetical protein